MAEAAATIGQCDRADAGAQLGVSQMEPLLYLVHRIPYPPNKGDKIRSFNLLRHLAERHSVFLGCFVDSAEDAAYVNGLRDWCAEVCAVPLDPRIARLRSALGLLTGEALTLPYYRSVRLARWVEQTVRMRAIRKAVAFSSPMAQYLRDFVALQTVIDLVDVDSAKWASYASEHRWPMSAVYRREGRRLLAFERAAVGRAAAGVLVTRAEVALFDRLAPECASKMHVIENGVDSEFFSPDPARPSPYPEDAHALAFTGVMDYWPNIDAVTWFAREVLPRIAERAPSARFYVVGMNPTPAVQALAADPRVVVTGKVDDVRPYLQHAAAVVAPLRIARGVQNKVLEAMAMARPVVVSAAAAAGIAAQKGVEFESADDADTFAACTVRVLDPVVGGQMGGLARRRISAAYQWSLSLARFSLLLGDPDTALPHGPVAALASPVAAG
ncbi:MAG: TIGR03087 family PEP-CTERM/XrtA system glycosyltransferase [Burkholderiaceae bacterium]|nr:TIGR03087 family PEP-CTERM/XrtA system glycosyltransferase [Burkholderiaceae bacterium]